MRIIKEGSYTWIFNQLCFHSACPSGNNRSNGNCIQVYQYTNAWIKDKYEENQLVFFFNCIFVLVGIWGQALGTVNVLYSKCRNIIFNADFYGYQEEYVTNAKITNYIPCCLFMLVISCHWICDCIKFFFL